MKLKPLFAALCLSASATVSAHAGEAAAAGEMKKHHKPHTVTIASEASFADTLSGLKAAIEARGFRLFAEIDHAKGAQSIDESLRPTTLLIFGNPKGGTPIMQADQRLGLELPLRALVFEDESGDAHVTFRDYPHLVKEYDATTLAPRFSKIDEVLHAMANEAGGQSAE